jgi:hypothetical protein
MIAVLKRLATILVVLVVIVVSLGLIVSVSIRLSVDTENPPPALEQSVETVISAMYPVLSGRKEPKKLSMLLAPGVSVYSLLGPGDDHPALTYEYTIDLYASRWHAGDTRLDA